MHALTLSCAHCGATNPLQAAACSSCGALLDQPPEDGNPASVPDRLLKGRYRLLKIAGTGGFGAVYQAEDIQDNNRIVAIKTIPQSSLKQKERQEAAEAFQREAYLLAGLNHPNLPRIYDSFREAGGRYLVMEFINGETLEQRLSAAPGNRLPVSDVLQIGLQLANVLDYLHTHQPPIIFRDLKPANVMLIASGHVYLIDFGIARLFKPGQANDTVMIGTPGYLAPEGYGKTQTTPRSDLYSLGATLHQLLSGIDPGVRPFFFAPLQPPVPAPLQALVAQMVQMEEEDRPANMADVKARLQQIEDGNALAAPTAVLSLTGLEEPHLAPGTDGAPPKPPSIVPVAGLLHLPTLPPAQNKSTVTRRSMAIGLGAVLAGGAIWALARTFAPKPRMIKAPVSTPTSSSMSFSTPIPPATPTPAFTSSGTTAYQIYRGHIQPIMALAWSPLDGAVLASASLDTTTQIWDTSSQLVVVTHQGVATKMVWSPDGQYIATSGGTDYQIHLWRASDGADLISYPIQAEGDLPALAWSPDGKRVASGGSDNTVQVWGATTGGNAFVYRGHTAPVTSVDWSTKSNHIASGGFDTTVQIWEPR